MSNTVMKTLYVGNDNTVMLTCPACDKSKVVDVSRYLTADGPVRFTYRFQCDDCRCGHSNCQECVRENCSLGHVNSVRLERRKSVRREMSVNGLFSTSENESVRVRVLDIARKTVRVEFSAAALAENAGKGFSNSGWMTATRPW